MAGGQGGVAPYGLMEPLNADTTKGTYAGVMHMEHKLHNAEGHEDSRKTKTDILTGTEGEEIAMGNENKEQRLIMNGNRLSALSDKRET